MGYGSVEALDRDAGKLLVRPRFAVGAGFIADVRAIVGSRALVTHSGTGNLAEIGPIGVTKASAVGEWCRTRGIEAGNAWAFGDMPNDLPLLAWAARSFAIANAHPEVLAAATGVCGSNADDGVAAVLERMLGI